MLRLVNDRKKRKAHTTPLVSRSFRPRFGDVCLPSPRRSISQDRLRRSHTHAHTHTPANSAPSRIKVFDSAAFGSLKGMGGGDGGAGSGSVSYTRRGIIVCMAAMVTSNRTSCVNRLSSRTTKVSAGLYVIHQHSIVCTVCP